MMGMTQSHGARRAAVPSTGAVPPGARARRGDPQGETGAVLILALVYLVAVSLVLLALASWTTNDLSSTSVFASSRSLQYAANSVTETAIQSVRYTPLLSTGQTIQTLDASPPNYCWGNGTSNSALVVDNDNVTVWCSTVWTPLNVTSTRVVTFSTCLSTVSAVACAQNPLLQAVVAFDDYPTGPSAPTSAQCVVFCGTSLVVKSWVWAPVVPTVTSISNSSGSIVGGTSFTMTGTGFIQNATSVNFVETNAFANYTVTVPASSVTWSRSTSISTVAPPVTAGTSYYVTVTTRGGTSADGPVFTYSPVAPSISALSVTSGSTSGGTAISISGTGFVTGATVNFVAESAGATTTPSVVLPAVGVSVTGPTTILASSPAVTVGTTYFVTVSTPSGSSSFGPIFTFAPLTPIVGGLTATAGPIAGGTGMTITGTGFVSGATVAFVKEVSGIPVVPAVSVPAAGATVTGSTTIILASPAVSGAGTYYVTVTTPGGTSAYGPTFTFS
jgi:hypothetical protein